MTDTNEDTPKRWSSQRKSTVVLRILRGEPIDKISREVAVPISVLEQWRDQGVQAMVDSLKARVNDPLEAEPNRAKKQLGEMTMEVELLRERCRRAAPLARGRHRL